jgi:hypothetical protein
MKVQILARRLAAGAPRNRIFVIIEVGDPPLDSAFENVYRVEGHTAGFDEVCRIECANDSAQLSREVIEQISTSRLIIADLTGERPNCYYEAGFAHALGKPIIFCIRADDPVHFDLAAYDFIVWESEADLRRKLKARLAMFVDKTARISAVE